VPLGRNFRGADLIVICTCFDKLKWWWWACQIILKLRQHLALQVCWYGHRSSIKCKKDSLWQYDFCFYSSFTL